MPDIHMESLRGVRDELVSLRAQVAELEAASPDDAHTGESEPER